MKKLIDSNECFACDYAEARDKFLRVSSSQDGRIATYEHPSATGPSGEKLAMDVAHFGDTSADRQLVIISGTHGPEGFAGSAIQVAAIHAGITGRLPNKVGLLMIHALNPFGFAHGTRTNEENVDLNRNFVEHAQGTYPDNEFYADIHPLLTPDKWDRASEREIEKSLSCFREERGQQAFGDALMGGQYTHPDGMIYGGNRRQWSNKILEQIVGEHLKPASKVGLIDWHTGIGDYGKAFFLCFNETGSESFERACDWWGVEKIRESRPHGFARPNYKGLVFDGLRSFLTDREMCGAVVEFGTRGPAVRRALRLDLWLRSKADQNTAKFKMLRDDMLDAFRPVDHSWREAVIDQGVSITGQAVGGMGHW
jgi:hypothetical protein